MCVVGEPTEMKVITGHKGKTSIRCHVRGKEAHSSLAPYGVNAVNAAARVVGYLADMAARKAAEGPSYSDFDVPPRSEERRVGQGGVSTVSSGWSPYH